MATKDQKKLYNDRVKSYKATLEDLKKKSSSLKMAARKKAHLEGYYTVQSAILGIQISNTLIQMSALSLAIQDFKNDSLLNDARKELGNVISSLIKVVGDNIDDSLSEGREKLEKVSLLNPLHKWNLVVAIKEALDALQQAMGTNSKWRWYFPDLYFKLAIVSKNLVDFKELDKVRRDPSAEFHMEYQELLRFVVQEAHDAAQQFRSKYELSTKEVSDLQIIQRIFEMLKKIYQFSGNREELTRIQTSLDAITEKVNILLAEKEKKKS